MTISFFVAASENGVIGKTGGIPWYLPGDLKRFKELTMGHPIIMGRKTYESIGRPLPGRTNIIITHDINYKAEGCVVAFSLEEALKEARKVENEEIFIIGGGAIFDLAEPLADKVYLTRVKAVIDGDILFHFNKQEWKKVFSEKHKKDDKNEYDYDFETYIRQTKR